jgi:hypothetical protein
VYLLESYPILPSVEGCLDDDDEEEENTESEVRSVWGWESEWFVADDTDDSGNTQEPSKAAEKVAKSRVRRGHGKSTFCERGGLEEETTGSCRSLEDDVGPECHRVLEWDCTAIEEDNLLARVYAIPSRRYP